MTDAIQLAADVLLAGVPYAIAFGLVRMAVPLFVVIVNFDKLYRLTMWVIRKLPLGIK